MAISVSTYEPGSNTGTTVVINKPTGTLSGDLLIAHIANDDTGTISSTGWTSINSDTVASSKRSTILYRLVDGTDGSSYTFSKTGGSSTIIGAILLIKGQKLVTPVSVDSVQDSGSTTTVTAPAITPSDANSLILFFTFNISGRTTSGYALTTSSPTFTEIYDTGASVHISCASGIRPETTSTGSATATISAAEENIGHLLAIKPALDVTVPAPDVFALGMSLISFFPPIIDILRATLALPTVTMRNWSDKSKSTSGSWTNQSKS